MDLNFPALERRMNDLATFGLHAAGRFLADKVREILNVAAPLKSVQSKKGPSYLRAATKATKGAPPRRVTGSLYRSVAYKVDTAARAVRVTVADPGEALEEGGHPFLAPTLAKYGEEAARRALRAAGV